MKLKQGLMLVGLTAIALSTSFASAKSAEQSKIITLEKIMSDPKWIANTPKNAVWLSDSTHLIFQQHRKESTLKDVVKLDTTSGAKEVISLPNRHLVEQDDLVFNMDHSLAAYEFGGDIFVNDINKNQVTQVTATSAGESAPQFLNDGRLVYWQGQTAFVVGLPSLKISEFLNLKMDEAPQAPKVADDLIATEQHELINYVAEQHAASIEKFEFKQALSKQSSPLKRVEFYLGKGNQVNEVSISPSGDKAIAVVAKDLPWRGENDLMPNYIGQDGRIHLDNVRRRVADAKPNQQTFWLLDLTSGHKTELALDSLPDYDKDVLKAVRMENAKANNEKYKSKKAPRNINLMVDWTWSQSAIQWQSSGEQVALMLEAWDNKDRWIATVDFESSRLVNQHQLHDDAWINYTFNDFGWFNNSERLYFLSEQSGYSHIYTKQIGRKKLHQVTHGEFEVSNLKLSKDDKHFYFRANVDHPGDYQIYRVASNLKRVAQPEAMTSLEGNNVYELSPDETKIMVSHSSLLVPDELYIVDVATKETIQLTKTVSEEFKAMPWVKPEIVAVPSSYQDQPVYAKVYYPADYKQGEKRRAVIFNHGAGYLQNSHKGWSGYFREFMFHSMLAQQGYVVMDMDYRASKGYGRDWRTAIYRQMGTPEIEDLRDGVNWLVKHANVDRDRIGTYGGSYGGFMTFMALFTQPDLFQAGAALRPVTDWAHYNDPYTSNILNRPQDDMLAYRRSSPIYFAEGLEKPLLINAPMIDDNVFFVDVVRLVQRLIELEKQDFETAIFPVEPHSFKQPSSWLDEYRRIYKLFEQHL